MLRDSTPPSPSFGLMLPPPETLDILPEDIPVIRNSIAQMLRTGGDPAKDFYRNLKRQNLPLIAVLEQLTEYVGYRMEKAAASTRVFIAKQALRETQGKEPDLSFFVQAVLNGPQVTTGVSHGQNVVTQDDATVRPPALPRASE